MTEALVSVIIASFNGERFLRETLESVFAQDYGNFEVIFVDDGSRDRTADIARSFPLTYIRQANQGPSAARNAGIRAAAGEFVAFSDDDDLMPPGKLRLQVRFLLDHGDVGCVLGRQEWMNPPPWLGRDPVYGDLDGVPLGSAMIRRALLDDIGGFDPSFRWAEDTDLLIRLRERGARVEVLPEVLLYRRFHGDNATAPANRSGQNPLLRSLKGKLDRERGRVGSAPGEGSER